jgi:uncharacterized protein (TIGR00251 family)
VRSDDTKVRLDLEPNECGIILRVRAHAGARRNSILGIRAGSLRVAVTAAPEKGKANQAIIALLSKALGVSKSSIEIVSGETSPQKRLRVRNIEMDQLRQLIAATIVDG